MPHLNTWILIRDLLFQKDSMEISREGSYVVYVGDLKAGVSAINDALGKIKAPNSGDDYLLVEKITVSIDDIRLIQDIHEQKSLSGDKTIVCAGSFITTQAQNALLKMIEETKEGERIFIVVPYEAELLSTITSRVQIIKLDNQTESEEAEKFISLPVSKRIKYIESNFLSMDESDEKRDAMLNFFRDLEEYVHSKGEIEKYEDLLTALPVLRQMLGNSGAPAKIIAEYVALAI